MNKKQILTLILCFILTLSSVMSTMAAGANSGYGQSDVNPSGGGQGTIANSDAALAWNEKWTGLRVYVTNDVGVPIENNAGSYAIDFLYHPEAFERTELSKDYKSYGTTFKDIVYAPGANSSNVWIRVGEQRVLTQVKNITEMDLSFDPTLTAPTPLRNYPTISNTGNRRANGKQGVYPHFENEEDYQTEHGMGLRHLAFLYWTSYANGFYENGYHLCIEQIFGFKIEKNGKPTGDFFYGTVYEWAKYCQANNINPSKMRFASFASCYIPKSI